jgi:hypothetical protein
MGVNLTDHQIAVRLMAISEGEDPDKWVEHWDPMFPNWGQQPHSGDCTKQPWTCCRCVYDDQMQDVPAARRLFGIGRPSKEETTP